MVLIHVVITCSKSNNRNNRNRYEACSTLTAETPEQRPLPAPNMQMLAGYRLRLEVEKLLI